MHQINSAYLYCRWDRFAFVGGVFSSAYRLFLADAFPYIRSYKEEQKPVTNWREGNNWGHIVENTLMVLRLLSESLCPGLAINGILTALQYFYNESTICSSRHGAIHRG